MSDYTLIGHPLGHSMSPLIHDELFRLRDKQSTYSLSDIDPSDLKNSRDSLLKFSGFNVTIPHKVAVIELIDELGESAERYNSVNCVQNKNGRLIGYNTDCNGFLLAVEGYPLNKNVLLIGCGGVGRMMATEVALHGGALTMGVIPDAMDTALALKDEILGLKPDANVNISLVSELNGSFDVIINASPVGMFPKSDACPVSDELIEKCEYVFDAIYNPVETQLIKKARALGKIANGGASMLVYQAVKAHEIWDGDTYTTDEISGIIKAVEDKINNG